MNSSLRAGPHAAFFIAIAAYALSPGAGACPATAGALQIEVVAAPLELRLSHTTPLNQLEQGTHPEGGVTLGETDAALGADFEYEELARSTESGGTGPCTTARVRIELAVNPVIVRIGRELPVGSCLYEQVRAHEWQHVQVYQRFLASAPQRLRVLVEGTEAGASGESPDLPTRMQAAISGWLDEQTAELRRTQAALDTPEEYRRLTTACATSR